VHAAENVLAALIGSHSADEVNAMAKVAQMQGKVEGSATQVFGMADYVPEHFPKAYRVHPYRLQP
jgi:hypothetical protein